MIATRVAAGREPPGSWRWITRLETSNVTMSATCATNAIAIHPLGDPPNRARSINIGPATLKGRYHSATR